MVWLLRLGADLKQQELSAALLALFWTDRTDDPLLHQSIPSLKSCHTFKLAIERSALGRIVETPLWEFLLILLQFTGRLVTTREPLQRCDVLALRGRAFKHFLGLNLLVDDVYMMQYGPMFFLLKKIISFFVITIAYYMTMANKDSILIVDSKL